MGLFSSFYPRPATQTAKQQARFQHRLAIQKLASRTPQLAWTRAECATWIAAYLDDTCGLPSARTAKKLRNFRECGAGMYEMSREEWVDAIGDAGSIALEARLKRLSKESMAFGGLGVFPEVERPGRDWGVERCREWIVEVLTGYCGCETKEAGRIARGFRQNGEAMWIMKKKDWQRLVGGRGGEGEGGPFWRLSKGGISLWAFMVFGIKEKEEEEQGEKEVEK